MQSTAISLTPEMSENFATGYQWGQEKSHWHFGALAATGALHSTLEDMTLFLATSMGIGDSRTSELLAFCEQKQFSLSPSLGMGLSWITSSNNGNDIIWQNGGTGGFKSYIGINPNTQRGVVILSNSAESWPDEFALQLLDPNFQPLKIDQDLASSPEYMSKFLGPYEVVVEGDQPSVEVNVYSFAKLLVIVLPNGEIGLLYPESFGVFGVKGFANAKVNFTLNTQRVVERLQAFDPNGSLLWQAVPKPRQE
jgi:hypothetical protein